VGFYTGSTEALTVGDTAILHPYDENGDLMGEIQIALPDPTSGITAFLGAGAVSPDRLIASVALQYGGGAVGQAPHLDDLILCSEKSESSTAVIEPPGPLYGTLPVTLRMRAVLIEGEEFTDEGEAHEEFIATPMIGLTVNIDGVDTVTDYDVIKNEGQSTTLVATATSGTAVFVHWEFTYDGGATLVHSSQEENFSLTMLRNGTLTAVYVDDPDLDGYPDLSIGDFADNCPSLNNDQSDLDGDGQGDTCDDDRDGDGLLNTVETATIIFNSPSDTGSLPDDADSDADGFDDGIEVLAGSDPNDPNSTPVSAVPALLPPLGIFLVLLVAGMGANRLWGNQRSEH